MNYKAVVHKQIGLGIFSIGALYLIFILLPTSWMESSREQALSISLLMLATPLFFGIGKVLMARYGNSTLINGYQASDEPIEFEKAYLENTKEQTLAATIVAVALNAVLPDNWFFLQYAQAFAFLLGRLVFYVGYRSSPMNRFSGFVITWYSTLISFSLALYFLFVHKI